MTTLQHPEAAKITALKFNGHKIELSINRNGKPVARLYKFLTVGKNKGQYKLLSGYYFTTELRRIEWINEQMTGIKSRIEYNERQKIAKKDAVSSHNFKVGDVLYSSWGYDQTNIDFWQIVEILPKSVKCRPISQIIVDGSEGMMCERVKPAIDKFTGEAETKLVKAYVSDSNGSNYYSVANGRYSLSLYEKGEKGLYQSHYA